jgi:hypothetical protein
MQVLRNIDHAFDVELGDVGCTVRKGTKWAEVPSGELLELMNCPTAHPDECHAGCYYEGLGEKIGHWVGPLKGLPKSLVAIEHNVKARNIVMLREMLETAYGELNDDDIYTALLYIRTKETQQKF